MATSEADGAFSCFMDCSSSAGTDAIAASSSAVALGVIGAGDDDDCRSHASLMARGQGGDWSRERVKGGGVELYTRAVSNIVQR